MRKTFMSASLFKLLLSGLFIILPLLHDVENAAAQSVLRVSDGKTITFQQMLEELKDVRVVIIGENHDSPEHHQLQMDIIEAFHEADLPMSIGLEMFISKNQRQLDRWVNGTLDERSFIRLYYVNWQMPWPLYSGILLYAREHRIPLLGLNIDPKIAKKVAHSGFASLTPKEQKKLPANITCNVDPAYKAFIKRAYTAHKMDDKTFTRFCEAQRLWNAAMAAGVNGYLKQHKEQHMVVLTGAGHALKSGMPAELENLSRLSYKVVLPEFAELDSDSVSSDDADYVVIN